MAAACIHAWPWKPDSSNSVLLTFTSRIELGRHQTDGVKQHTLLSPIKPANGPFYNSN